MFTVKPFQMTPKSLVYQVYFDGEFCFQHSYEETAQKIIAAFEQHGIVSMNTWHNSPWKLRRSFITATSNINPRFIR